MKRLVSLIAILLLAGCLATENRKVEITSRGIAPTASNTLWYRSPYRADRSLDNKWDALIPVGDLPESQWAQDAELEYFKENVIKWPKTMPPGYKPAPIWTTPGTKSKSDSMLRERLRKFHERFKEL